MSRRYNDYTMKELAKMIANTNEKSLSEMIDSLNKFEEKPLKFVDLETDIANLKTKIAKQDPLFTLTAEEVEMVRYALEYIQSNSIYYNPLLNEVIIDGNPYYPILTRIKQYQDENNIHNSML